MKSKQIFGNRRIQRTGRSALVALLLFFAGCGEDLPQVQTDIVRYEGRLLQLGVQDSSSCLEEFYKTFGREKYNLVYWLYEADSAAYDTALGSVQKADSALAQDLCQMGGNEAYQDLTDSIYSYFPPDFNFAELFHDPLARLKKFFPEDSVPIVRSIAMGHTPGVHWQIGYTHDRVAWHPRYRMITFSLDYFCRPGFPLLPPDMPRYIRHRCAPDYLLPAVFHAMAIDYHQPIQQVDRPRLLDYMINAGIRYAFVEAMLPDTPDSLLLRYTEPQMEWCEDHEEELYELLLPILYEQNPQVYDRYVNMGPRTKGLDPNAPSRLGEFIGWQIVRQYLDDHPEVTLLELMATRDYTQLFKAARYKP